MLKGFHIEILSLFTNTPNSQATAVKVHLLFLTFYFIYLPHLALPLAAS